MPGSLVALAFVLAAGSAKGQAVNEKPPGWEPAGTARFAEVIAEWRIAAGELPDEAEKQLEQLLADPKRLAEEPLDCSLEALVIAFPHLEPDVRHWQTNRPGDGPWQPGGLPNAASIPETARQTLCLGAGRWLVRYGRFDEAIGVLEQPDVGTSLDPAGLLYYRGLAWHRLTDPDRCIDSLERLLQGEALLPRRFASTARLMLADMRGLQADSLDEISRLMDDIGRRQKLGHSGQRVIGLEQDVLGRLDQLIEEAEQQLAAQTSAEPSESAVPMPDSRSAEGTGSGQVTDRGAAGGGEWGNLPPARRAAALVEMTRDLPPHYREVIEEYFRQLARLPAR